MLFQTLVNAKAMCGPDSKGKGIAFALAFALG